MPTLRARAASRSRSSRSRSRSSTSDYLLNTGYSPAARAGCPTAVDRPHARVRRDPGETARREFYVLIVVVLALRAVDGARPARAAAPAACSSACARTSARPRRTRSARAARSCSRSRSRASSPGVAGALFVLQQHALDADELRPDRGPARVRDGRGRRARLDRRRGARRGLRVRRRSTSSRSRSGRSSSTGAGLLLVLMLLPGGLGAAFGDARDGVLRWYARRKRHPRAEPARRHARRSSRRRAEPDGAAATRADAKPRPQVDELVEVRE